MKLGVWPVQRMRALTCLEHAIAHDASTSSRNPQKHGAPDTSRRLSIALWEDDIDAAWQAAQSGRCQQSLRISLAKALASTRAQDAIDLYRQLVPEIVGQTGNEAYASAIHLVREMQGLMIRLGQIPEFDAYLTELRATCKPKRNFIKLLDGVTVPR